MTDASAPTPNTATTTATTTAPTASDLIHRAIAGIQDTAESVTGAIAGVVHRVNAAQTWTTIAGELAPVFEQTLGPVVVAAEHSALTLVDPRHLAGYEAAFGSLAASGLKALLARIAIPAAAAAVVAAP